ncbi:hypothetical protein [Kitasatospora sp. NPDC059571]|uniref:hypothetical protein n=1 Tax=Kitasatospora sp. NPDC059571 TaxID=3346871 RepID=UPI00368A0C58
MEQGWDFARWRDALREAGPRRAALVGLAAAERASGCLTDGRAARFDGEGPVLVRALLDACWDGADPALVLGACESLADWATRYTESSLTELFRAWAAEEADDEDDTGPPELAEFLDEVEPAGAIALHLTAAMAAAQAGPPCAGGAWDGALRCLQSLSDLPGEAARQHADLAAVLAADEGALPAAARELRKRAAADAPVYREHCEALDLDAD